MRLKVMQYSEVESSRMAGLLSLSCDDALNQAMHPNVTEVSLHLLRVSSDISALPALSSCVRQAPSGLRRESTPSTQNRQGGRLTEVDVKEGHMPGITCCIGGKVPLQ